MREIQIDEIKTLSFQVLQAVAAVCQEHGLSYSLTGGTLLGAVRHKGFIPWDDDIDLMMPRPDYDRFIQIVGSGDYGFDLKCKELSGDGYWYPFAKACHRDTLVVEAAIQESDVKLGVFVDIFPVDGAGNSPKTAKLRAMVFQTLHGLKVTSNWTHYRRSKLRKWYYEPARYVCYLLSRVLGRKRIDKMLGAFLKRKSYTDCAYCGRLVGDFGSKEVMPRALFENIITLPFEGGEFHAIADYDTFLTSLYGDYMQLPPAHKQVSHHEFTAYRVD